MLMHVYVVFGFVFMHLSQCLVKETNYCMLRKLLLKALGIFIGFPLMAQVTVTGTVTDQTDNLSVPGVTVLEKGTQNGTITDFEGNYSIQVNEGAVLIFSFVGMETKEVQLGNSNVVNVTLVTSITELSEVVVTAYGVEKEKKSLGFAQTEVLGEELTQAKDVSMASMLYGKVSGTAILKPSTGPAGSTKISIRGNNRIPTASDPRADVDPLIVVDGVPIDNTRLGETGQYGGVDRGDAFSSINPDDIESINILKGAAAGTLYGERGANGVIVITTKKGTKDLVVNYNGTFMTDQPAFFQDFFQNQYGQGRRGDRPGTQSESLTQWSSWGELLDGSDFTYYDGVTRPYSAAPENDIRNFYKNGHTITNNFAIGGGNQNTTSRLSVSSLNNEGIVPSSTYERYTANLTSSMTHKKLTLGMKMSYVEESSENRTNNGDFPSNPGKAFISLPTNVSSSMLKETIRNSDVLDPTKSAIPWNDNVFIPNPYWGTKVNSQADQRRRIIGYLMAKYQFMEELSLQVRYAVDWSKADDQNIIEQGSEWQPNGAFSQSTTELNDRTIDFLLNYTDNFSWLGVNINLGGVQNPISRYDYRISGSNFIIPELYHINNLASKDPEQYNQEERKTNGFYANATLDFARFVFIEGSIRNDWYSVLSTNLGDEFSDNTQLYASGSISAIVSDMVTLPELVDYAKVRGSYGSAGSANIPPYRILPVYSLEGQAYDGKNQTLPLGQISNSTFANLGLRPTVTKSFEVGTDLSFLSNRVGMNFTYYKENTIEQLLPVKVSSFTGYNSTDLNVGDIRNSGVEIAINATPVKTDNLQWDVSLNYTNNTNILLRVVNGVDAVVGESARFNAFTQSVVGDQINDIYGTSFERDEQGRIVHDENGLPIIAEGFKRLGNFSPDYFGGLSNTVKYKNFTFNVLLDYKMGGEIFSLSNALALSNGKHEETLRGRDNPFFELVGDGVTVDGQENNTFVFIDQYFARMSNAAEYSIFDASFVKVRQIIISYDLPSAILDRTPFSYARVGLVGRNLFFLMNGLSDLGMDPESVYSTSGSGFEYASLPTPRSMGLNISLRF